LSASSAAAARPPAAEAAAAAAGEAAAAACLFKRSLLLIKAWCLYESPKYADKPVLGAVDGGLATAALNVMVAALFAGHGGAQAAGAPARPPIRHPLHALARFLSTYAGFRWECDAVSAGAAEGRVPLRLLAPHTHGTVEAPQSGAATSPTPPAPPREGIAARVETAAASLLGAAAAAAAGNGSAGDKVAALLGRPSAEARFPVRHVNVADPLAASNNLGRSVSGEGLGGLRQALLGGRRHFAAILSCMRHGGGASAGGGGSTDGGAAAAAMLDTFFSSTWRRYGGALAGCRPDLLLHPRQAWPPAHERSIGELCVTKAEEVSAATVKLAAQRLVAASSTRSRCAERPEAGTSPSGGDAPDHSQRARDGDGDGEAASVAAAEAAATAAERRVAELAAELERERASRARAEAEAEERCERAAADAASAAEAALARSAVEAEVAHGLVAAELRLTLAKAQEQAKAACGGAGAAEAALSEQLEGAEGEAAALRGRLEGAEGEAAALRERLSRAEDKAAAAEKAAKAAAARAAKAAKTEKAAARRQEGGQEAPAAVRSSTAGLSRLPWALCALLLLLLLLLLALQQAADGSSGGGGNGEATSSSAAAACAATEPSPPVLPPKPPPKPPPRRLTQWALPGQWVHLSLHTGEVSERALAVVEGLAEGEGEREGVRALKGQGVGAAAEVAALTYVWSKDGVVLAGETRPTLDIHAATEASAGEYAVRMSSVGEKAAEAAAGAEAAGAGAEERVRLRIARPPVTESRLVSHTIAAGAHFELALNVTAGEPAPAFQWRKNGVDITRATGDTLIIGSASWQDAGTYTCLVSNVAGEVEWEEAALGVLDEVESAPV
jgi:hypothetical protein